MSKKIWATLLTFVMVLGIIAATPATQVRAASASSNTPYNFISYDSSTSSYTSVYYDYSSGFGRIDYTRGLTWKGSTLSFTNSGDVITKKMKAGSTPAWANNGSYLVWQEDGNVLQIQKYGTSSPTSVSNVTTITLDAENMVKSVTMSDKTTKTISELVKSGTSSGNSSKSDSGSGSASGDADSGSSNSKSGSGSNNSSNAGSNSKSEPITVSPSTDSAGRMVYKISNGHKVVVDGKDVYYDDYKISELCNSGVRFVGIDASGNVYLYEDASASYYRFKQANIFSPEKIKLASGAELVKAVTNSNNVLTAIQTSVGTFKVSQLVVDKTWYPSKTYAINKSGYCQYYLADTNKSYTLTLKGSALYLGAKQIQTGISRKENSFGFAGSKIYSQKGSKAYWATIKAPTKWNLWKQNVARLKYSASNGQVSGIKRLSTKSDYVKNSKSHKSATLYQSGSKSKVIKITAKGTKVTLKGKVIAKLSKKQKKAGVKYTAVGFTEDGNIYVATNKAKYKAALSAPKKLKKWSVSKVKFDTLGFCSKG